MLRAGIDSSCSVLPRISAAALLVKVTPQTPCGEAPSASTSQAISVNENTGLTAAGPRHHKQVAHRRGDSLALRLV